MDYLYLISPVVMINKGPVDLTVHVDLHICLIIESKIQYICPNIFLQLDIEKLPKPILLFKVRTQ